MSGYEVYIYGNNLDFYKTPSNMPTPEEGTIGAYFTVSYGDIAYADIL